VKPVNTNDLIARSRFSTTASSENAP
jgi:hypothetical protein